VADTGSGRLAIEASSAADMISITSGEYTTLQPKKFCIVAVTRQFPSGACFDERLEPLIQSIAHKRGSSAAEAFCATYAL
jgi:hypothetical protein